jgi:predicted nucleotidyltransferase
VQSLGELDEMRRRAVEKVASQAKSAAICKHVCVIEIGGSYGRGEADIYSDVDLFIYVDDDAMPGAVSSISSALVDAVGSPKAVSGPDYKEGFGWTYSADFSGPGVISFLFRSIRELGDNPMRIKAAPVAYDRDEVLGEVLPSDKAASILDLTDRSSGALVTCYMRLLDVRKEVARENLWQARKYYREVLEQIIILTRISVGSVPRGGNFRQPGRGIERELRPAFVRAINRLEADCDRRFDQALFRSTIDMISGLEDELSLTRPKMEWGNVLRRIEEQLGYGTDSDEICLFRDA